MQNLTGKNIPEVVKQTLTLGPQFAVKENSSEIDYSTLLADVEYCIKRKKNVDDDNQQLLRLNIAILITNYKTKNRNSNKFYFMKKNYSLTKEYLEDNPDLMTVESGKAITTVVLLKKDYIAGIENMLQDTLYYKIAKSK